MSPLLRWRRSPTGLVLSPGLLCQIGIGQSATALHPIESGWIEAVGRGDVLPHGLGEHEPWQGSAGIARHRDDLAPIAENPLHGREWVVLPLTSPTGLGAGLAERAVLASIRTGPRLALPAAFSAGWAPTPTPDGRSGRRRFSAAPGDRSARA